MSRVAATIDLLLLLAILVGVLLLTFGCEAVNVSATNPLGDSRADIIAAVYDTNPPASQPAELPIDTNEPFAALRIWWHESFDQPTTP